MASNNIVFRDSYGFRKQIPVTILDDDIRNTQCLIGDIACRITIRNPQLLGDVLKSTPDIVLIDDIELHLQPEWQRMLLGDLRPIFPQIQFIVSTGTDSIVESVGRKDILALPSADSVPACLPA